MPLTRSSATSSVSSEDDNGSIRPEWGTDGCTNPLALDRASEALDRHDRRAAKNALKKVRNAQLLDLLRRRQLDTTNAKKDELIKRLLESLELGVPSSNGSAGGVRGDDVRLGMESPSNGHGGGAPAKAAAGEDAVAEAIATKNKLSLKEEREGILLWTRPFTTIHYSFLELVHTVYEWSGSLLLYRRTLVLLAAVALVLAASCYVDGPHHKYFQGTERYLLWCMWWVGLGVLSSVGLGTGLHTFILYLGPHIAAVTMAAYVCGSVDFREPEYPDSIMCAAEEGAQAAGQAGAAVTVWTIMTKVRVEAFCWGVGTALGELPPYFMARAHRLSGFDPDDDEADEFEELAKKTASADPASLSAFDRAKLGVEKLIERVGFFGILACASIPNPLFDLAGITCGHFLVPFGTFFGATLIGKAVVKMHIQKVFIILAFNDALISSAVSGVSRIPWVGPRLQEPFKQLLAAQKEKLHAGKAGTRKTNEANVLSWIFEKFILAMVAYFVVSIANSLAQSYHKRLHKKSKAKST